MKENVEPHKYDEKTPIFVDQESHKDKGFVFASMETKGQKSVDMENTILSTQIANPQTGANDHIFGVFDGHRGSKVSIFCQAVLPKLVELNLKILFN